MRNVLAIGAHPDDVEMSCGGTLLKHVLLGDKVTILHMTNSGYSNSITGEILRTSEQSKSEALDSAKLLNCEMIQLDFIEQKIPFNIESITAIEKVIIDKKIDLIYTHSSLDTHQDHIAVYNSVMAASRNVHNIFSFEQLPLFRMRYSDNPNFFVNITDFFDKKIEACRAHTSQVKGKYGDKILQSLRALSEYRGSQIGCKNAEGFITIKSVFL